MTLGSGKRRFLRLAGDTGVASVVGIAAPSLIGC